MKTTVEIKFGARRIPGGADAIVGPSGCGKDVVNVHEYTIVDVHCIDVRITLDETDPRVANVFALLDKYGVESFVYRCDVYTEDELQAAPLLVPIPWGHVRALAVAKYDDSQACPRCETIFYVFPL